MFLLFSPCMLTANINFTTTTQPFNHIANRIQSNDLDIIKTWSIFGDPSVQVRTDAPKAITVSNETVTSGTPFGRRFNRAWFIPRLIVFFALIAPKGVVQTESIKKE